MVLASLLPIDLLAKERQDIKKKKEFLNFKNLNPYHH